MTHLDPFADDAFENALNGELPPEAYKDADQLAADLFLGSVEIITSSWLPPEPPECPVLALAA